MSKINSTDLHVQYTLETGEHFQWERGRSDHNHSGSGYHATTGYDRNYAYWLEEKYLKSLERETENKELHELIKYSDRELEDATEYINSLEEEIEDLTDTVLKLKNKLVTYFSRKKKK